MAGKTVLITGGAGFIGSHVADELLRSGYAVRALDSLVPQVHGGARPDYLSREVDLIVGDVRDAAAVRRALEGVDAVFHFAAIVGVGQSMYQIEQYVDTNIRGTAVLLEALAQAPVERLIVASSMSIYGEGLYITPTGRRRSDCSRTLEQLRQGRWELFDSQGDGQALTPVPTDEAKTPALNSVYAVNKYDQERMCLIVAQAYGFEAVALRFFNTYGPRQALSNPYTGVLAIFASRLLNGKAPLIFEDGLQQRDFVSIHDVARASRLALESPRAAGMTFNIASGRQYTVTEAAARMAEATGRPDIAPQITGQYRVGDVRHCFADISLATDVLGYRPQVALDQGLEELAQWLSTQAAQDNVEAMRSELAQRGLTI
ncbi:MAG: SDR family NAD(P)-dependent oxidoreductase [Planctomycetaceae bacterium]|nr:SDR family NAD(P)-dependent oxidoreductase [Planctomycetaceae bacterium]